MAYAYIYFISRAMQPAFREIEKMSNIGRKFKFNGRTNDWVVVHETNLLEGTLPVVTGHDKKNGVKVQCRLVDCEFIG
jgi:hypothetical protein